MKASLPNEVHHSLASGFLQRVINGEFDVHVPEFVWTEFVCALRRLYEQDSNYNKMDRRSRTKLAIRWAEHLFNLPHVKLATLDSKFCYRSAYWGANCCLRGADAVVAFSAVEWNSNLLTADAEQKKRMEVAIAQYAALTASELAKAEPESLYADIPSRCVNVQVLRLEDL
jgi:predicted nucleic acid-binding protein